MSDQPILINDITLICNGEIYNYKNLYSELHKSYVSHLQLNPIAK